MPVAQRFFADAQLPLAKKLSRCFKQLEQDPRNHPNIKVLTGAWKGHLRYRVGDYRVIYRIDEAGKVVIVAIIAHRSEVYE